MYCGDCCSVRKFLVQRQYGLSVEAASASGSHHPHCRKSCFVNKEIIWLMCFDMFVIARLSVCCFHIRIECVFKRKMEVRNELFDNK